MTFEELAALAEQEDENSPTPGDNASGKSTIEWYPEGYDPTKNNLGARPDGVPAKGGPAYEKYLRHERALWQAEQQKANQKNYQLGVNQAKNQSNPWQNAHVGPTETMGPGGLMMPLDGTVNQNFSNIQTDDEKIESSIGQGDELNRQASEKYFSYVKRAKEARKKGVQTWNGIPIGVNKRSKRAGGRVTGWREYTPVEYAKLLKGENPDVDGLLEGFFDFNSKLTGAAAQGISRLFVPKRDYEVGTRTEGDFLLGGSDRIGGDMNEVSTNIDNNRLDEQLRAKYQANYNQYVEDTANRKSMPTKEEIEESPEIYNPQMAELALTEAEAAREEQNEMGLLEVGGQLVEDVVKNRRTRGQLVQDSAEMMGPSLLLSAIGGPIIAGIGNVYKKAQKLRKLAKAGKKGSVGRAEMSKMLRKDEALKKFRDAIIRENFGTRLTASGKRLVEGAIYEAAIESLMNRAKGADTSLAPEDIAHAVAAEIIEEIVLKPAFKSPGIFKKIATNPEGLNPFRTTTGVNRQQAQAISDRMAGDEFDVDVARTSPNIRSLAEDYMGPVAENEETGDLGFRVHHEPQDLVDKELDEFLKDTDSGYDAETIRANAKKGIFETKRGQFDPKDNTLSIYDNQAKDVQQGIAVEEVTHFIQSKLRNTDLGRELEAWEAQAAEEYAQANEGNAFSLEKDELSAQALAYAVTGQQNTPGVDQFRIPDELANKILAKLPKKWRKQKGEDVSKVKGDGYKLRTTDKKSERTDGLRMNLFTEKDVHADHNSLKIAKEMEKSKTDTEEIWAKTGWAKNPENGEWVFEVANDNVTLKDHINKIKNRFGPVKHRRNIKVEDVTGLDNVIKTLPVVGKVPVVLDPEKKEGSPHTHAEVKKYTNIFEDTEFEITLYDVLERDEKAVAGSLLHEVQHVIQDKQSQKGQGANTQAAAIDLASEKKRMKGAVQDDSSQLTWWTRRLRDEKDPDTKKFIKNKIKEIDTRWKYGTDLEKIGGTAKDPSKQDLVEAGAFYEGEVGEIGARIVDKRFREEDANERKKSPFSGEKDYDSRAVNIAGRSTRFNLERTSEFKKWFKKSKVVNEDGSPKVVYHGAEGYFTEFDSDDSIEGAHFFTDDLKTGQTYTADDSKKDTVGRVESGDLKNLSTDDLLNTPSTYHAYLKIENPLIIDADDSSWDEVPFEGKLLNTTEIIKVAKSRGHDGVELKNVYDQGQYGVVKKPSNVYVTFSAENIKSVSNKGTFDSENKDIRFNLERNKPDKDRELISLTNRDARSLEGLFEDEGFYAPSVAVTKKGIPFSDFGDVSFIMDKSVVDPKNKTNKTYPQDAYTPRNPQFTKTFKASESNKVLREIEALPGFDVLNRGFEVRHNRDLENLKESLNMKNAFLTKRGKGVKPVEATGKDAFKKENPFLHAVGIFLDWPTSNMEAQKVYREFDGPDKIFVAEEIRKGYIEGRMRDIESKNPNRTGAQRAADLKRVGIRTDALLIDKKGHLTEGFFNILNGTEAYQEMEQALKPAGGVDEYATRNAIRSAWMHKVDWSQQKPYDKWVSDFFKDVTSTKRFYDQKTGKDRKWTPRNVIESMKEVDPRGKEKGSTGDPGSTRARLVKPFKSMEEMRQNRNRIVPDYREGYEGDKGEDFDVSLERFTWAVDMVINQRETALLYDILADFSDQPVLSKDRYIDSFNKVTKEYRRDIDLFEGQGYDEAVKAIKVARTMATEYYESKPQKLITFDKVALAVIPKELDTDLKQKFKNFKIPTEEYNDSMQRQEIIDSIDDKRVRFNLQRTMDDLPGKERERLEGKEVKKKVALTFPAVDRFEEIQQNVPSITRGSGLVVYQTADIVSFLKRIKDEGTPEMQEVTKEDIEEFEIWAMMNEDLSEFHIKESLEKVDALREGKEPVDEGYTFPKTTIYDMTFESISDLVPSKRLKIYQEEMPDGETKPVRDTLWGINGMTDGQDRGLVVNIMLEDAKNLQKFIDNNPPNWDQSKVSDRDLLNILSRNKLYKDEHQKWYEAENKPKPKISPVEILRSRTVEYLRTDTKVPKAMPLKNWKGLLEKSKVKGVGTPEELKQSRFNELVDIDPERKVTSEYLADFFEQGTRNLSETRTYIGSKEVREGSNSSLYRPALSDFTVQSLELSEDERRAMEFQGQNTARNLYFRKGLRVKFTNSETGESHFFKLGEFVDIDDDTSYANNSVVVNAKQEFKERRAKEWAEDTIASGDFKEASGYDESVLLESYDQWPSDVYDVFYHQALEDTDDWVASPEYERGLHLAQQDLIDNGPSTYMVYEPGVDPLTGNFMEYFENDTQGMDALAVTRDYLDGIIEYESEEEVLQQLPSLLKAAPPKKYGAPKNAVEEGRTTEMGMGDGGYVNYTVDAKDSEGYESILVRMVDPKVIAPTGETVTQRFNDPHWKGLGPMSRQPVVGFIRKTDKVVDGVDTYFVEETQSDWDSRMGGGKYVDPITGEVTEKGWDEAKQEEIDKTISLVDTLKEGLQALKRGVTVSVKNRAERIEQLQAEIKKIEGRQDLHPVLSHYQTSEAAEVKEMLEQAKKKQEEDEAALVTYAEAEKDIEEGMNLFQLRKKHPFVLSKLKIAKGTPGNYQFVNPIKDPTALLAKRVLADAIEQGKTRVAWTTPEQQADRYSRQLSRPGLVQLTYIEDVAGQPVYAVEITDRPTERMDMDKLGATIGRGAATSISRKMKSQGLHSNKKIYTSTVDDFVYAPIGKGMIHQYDVALPKAMAELLKPYLGKKGSKPKYGMIENSARTKNTAAQYERALNYFYDYADEDTIHIHNLWGHKDYALKALFKSAKYSEVLNRTYYDYQSLVGDGPAFDTAEEFSFRVGHMRDFLEEKGAKNPYIDIPKEMVEDYRNNGFSRYNLGGAEIPTGPDSQPATPPPMDSKERAKTIIKQVEDLRNPEDNVLKRIMAIARSSGIVAKSREATLDLLEDPGNTTSAKIKENARAAQSAVETYLHESNVVFDMQEDVLSDWIATNRDNLEEMDVKTGNVGSGQDSMVEGIQEGIMTGEYPDYQDYEDKGKDKIKNLVKKNQVRLITFDGAEIALKHVGDKVNAYSVDGMRLEFDPDTSIYFDIPENLAKKESKANADFVTEQNRIMETSDPGSDEYMEAFNSLWESEVRPMMVNEQLLIEKKAAEDKAAEEKKKKKTEKKGGVKPLQTELALPPAEKPKPETIFDLSDENRRQSFYRSFVDKFSGIKRLEKVILEKLGQLPRVAPYQALELYPGRAEEALNKIDRVADKVLKVMIKNKITPAMMSDFMYAQHAVERNKAMAKINDGTPNLSGMTDAEAVKILKDFETAGMTRTLTKLFKMLQADRNHLNQELVANGVRPENTQESYDETYKYYVPLKGTADPLKSSEGGKKSKGVQSRDTSKAAMGRKSKAQDDILATYLSDMAADAVQIEKAKVGKTVLEMVENNPNDAFWEINPKRTTKVRNKSTGEVEEMPNPYREGEANVFSVQVDGQSKKIVFHTVEGQRLAMALNGMDQEGTNKALEILGKWNRYLGSVLTSYNPPFVISNAFRDAQTALYNIGVEQSMEMAKKTGKGVVPALKGIYRKTRGKEAGVWGEYWQEMVEAGGKTGFAAVPNTEKKLQEFQNKYNMSTAEWTKQPGTKLKKLAIDFLDLVEDMNSSVENAIRLAYYRALRDGGFSKENAASAAKNLTVNFNRKGQYGGDINKMFLFFNAAVQGSDRIYQSYKKNPKKFKALAAMLTSVGFSLGAYNQLMGGDDEESGVSYWEKVPDYVKASNFVFMIPGGKGKHVKIPMPYGHNALVSAGYRSADILFNPRVNKVNQAYGIMNDIVNAANPLGAGGGLLTMISPTVTDMAVELKMNENFAGSPIYRKPSPFSKVPAPKSEGAFKSTGAPFVAMSKGLNKLSGGDTEISGKIDINPDVLEHIWDGYTGGTGKFFKKTYETFHRGFQGEFEPAKTPFISKVYGKDNEYYDQSQFYANNSKQMTKIKQKGWQYKTRAKRLSTDAYFANDGRIPPEVNKQIKETVDKLAKESHGYVVLVKVYEKIKTQVLGKMRKARLPKEEQAIVMRFFNKLKNKILPLQKQLDKVESDSKQAEKIRKAIDLLVKKELRILTDAL